MLVVYLAHQLSAPTREGIEQNRRNAAKWAAWLWRQGFSVECSWIVCTGELEETPENRELGLKSDCEQARRCDVMVLCGPKISSGMLREAGAAKVLIDFTYLGLELPTPELRWHSGAPVTLQEIEKASPMSSLPVRTPAEVLEQLRELVLKNPEKRGIAIHVFGWACGVCLAAGLTINELAAFIEKYKYGP